jgi:hypothetical protein
MDVVELSRPDYRSYLLRLWGNAAQTVWRASLQSTTTQQIHEFPSLETLVAFLVTELAAAGDSGPPAIEDSKP